MANTVSWFEAVFLSVVLDHDKAIPSTCESWNRACRLITASKKKRSQQHNVVVFDVAHKDHLSRLCSYPRSRLCRHFPPLTRELKTVHRCKSARNDKWDQLAGRLTIPRNWKTGNRNQFTIPIPIVHEYLFYLLIFEMQCKTDQMIN